MYDVGSGILPEFQEPVMCCHSMQIKLGCISSTDRIHKRSIFHHIVSGKRPIILSYFMSSRLSIATRLCDVSNMGIS